MTTQHFRPEVEERLRQLDPSAHQPDAVPTEIVARLTPYLRTR